MSSHPSIGVPQIAVVLPVFNERELLPVMHHRLSSVLEQMRVTYEIVIVNDGSSDGSWNVILDLANRDPRTKAINLSRNFGHQLAITAGIEVSRAETVVVMDSDLQDPPEVIPLLYTKYLEGFDVAYGQRRHREGETLWKRTTAMAFYRLVRSMTNLDIPVDAGDFRLMSRRVVDDLRRFHEQHRFLRGLVTWVGYNQTPVLYDRERRRQGKTKFSTRKMIAFALDGITSMSIRPLRLASHAGLFLAMASLAAMIALIVYKVAGGRGLVPGWTSLAVAMLFIGGIQLLALGLLGEYIGRIHDEVKQRPMYLVRDRVNVAVEDPGRDPQLMTSRRAE
jgi:glycosyltransferase involved in cell wall biosynthesis